MIGDCQWLRTTNSGTAIVKPLPTLPKRATELTDDELDDQMRRGYRALAAMGDPCVSTATVSP